MKWSGIRSPFAGRQRVYESHAESADPRWWGLYRVGGAAALAMVTLIQVQVAVYVVWPPPAFDGPALPWFELLQNNRLLGLLSLASSTSSTAPSWP
jgi:hypothetical protein